MDTRTSEFRDLSDWLGLPASEIGRIVGRSTNMIRQYRAAKGRVPTETVLETLRAHRRSQLRGRLDRAIADIREAGGDAARASVWADAHAAIRRGYMSRDEADKAFPCSDLD